LVLGVGAAIPARADYGVVRFQRHTRSFVFKPAPRSPAGAAASCRGHGIAHCPSRFGESYQDTEAHRSKTLPLDPEAIARVRSEAWPEVENADELHDALVWLGFLTGAEVESDPRWSGWLADLSGQKRAARFDVGRSTLWISAERLPQFRALWPKLKTAPALAVPTTV
jgi:hypothetical protein